MNIDLTPIGTVAQMNAVKAVAKVFKCLGEDVSYDLLQAFDTMGFQDELDGKLDDLREEFKSTISSTQQSVLEIIPNLMEQ